MATGQRAFPGELFSQVVDAILHVACPFHRTHVQSEISGDFERIILKLALDKDPDNATNVR